LTGHHAGALLVGSGDSVCLAPGAHQSGQVTIEAGGHFHSNGADISGGLTAASPAAISICGTRVSGDVSITGATAPVLIGEPATEDCDGNTIRGDVEIAGDTLGTDFSGNSVSGGATLTNNVGGFVFGDLAANSIQGAVVTSGNV
jgi:hypothetical protein